MESLPLYKNIIEMAESLGFADISFAKVTKLEEECTFLEKYIASGYNADMSYLERNLDKRKDPSLLVEGARTIICLLASYKNYFEFPEGVPKIASYALGEDYHEVLKAKMRVIGELIKEHDPGSVYRAFTDSAPVFERAWAARAGLGFIGKNTMLISPGAGTRTFIGVIITTAEFEFPLRVPVGSCGNCRRCIDACPTEALSVPYLLDARKCISYQTIESKRMKKDEKYVADYKGYIFGCDICIDACPWSKKGSITLMEEFLPQRETIVMSREKWLGMMPSEFKASFESSPLMRAGLEKIKDNILYNGTAD